MKRRKRARSARATATFVVVAFAWIALPPTATARFEGFTSASAFGSNGTIDNAVDCESDFPNSRMCFSEELLAAAPIPDISGTTAWVHPTFSPSSDGRVLDASGISATSGENLSCGGWSSGLASNTGLSVDSSGRFGLSLCSSFIKVACCTNSLVAVPAFSSTRRLALLVAMLGLAGAWLVGARRRA